MSRYRDDDDYGRGSGAPAREYDDHSRERYGGRGDYGVESRRSAREMDDFEYRNRPRYDERDNHAPPRGGDNRADEERARYEEGRDYLQQRYGRGRRRGASRSHLRCRDIMTRDVTVATRDATLEEVAAMMRDEDTGIIPVVDRAEMTGSSTPGAEEPRAHRRHGSSGRLAGLITDRDLVVRAVAEGKDAHATRAEEIMTTDLHTAQPNDRVIDAIRKMGDKQVRRIPVVDRDGSLRGIISMADVALETEEDRELADALEEISSGSSFWSKVLG
ncbi:MAG TPA: CBS domain-containing protein [Pyrinomonadaceae bacterium]|nr:CBS domain-containing protein [Pyrinomonadaceae bacterium]